MPVLFNNFLSCFLKLINSKPNLRKKSCYCKIILIYIHHKPWRVFQNILLMKKILLAKHKIILHPLFVKYLIDYKSKDLLYKHDRL